MFGAGEAIGVVVAPNVGVVALTKEKTGPEAIPGGAAAPKMDVEVPAVDEEPKAKAPCCMGGANEADGGAALTAGC